MKIAISTLVRGKPKTDEENRKLTFSYENVDITSKELATLVKVGYSYCPQHKNNHRKTSNFISSSVITADVDYGMTLEEAMNDEFIKNNSTFIYTTENHTVDFPRFRIVFELDSDIADSNKMNNALSGLIKKLGSDVSCKDSCRQFYGNRNCEIIWFGNTLSDNHCNNIIKLGEEVNKTKNRKDDSSSTSKCTIISENTIESDCVVQAINGAWHKIIDLPPHTQVHCPVHTPDDNASAFTVMSKVGVPGVHCSTCGMTYFTSKDIPLYDFNYNLTNLDGLGNQDIVITDDNGYVTYIENSITRVNERYIPEVQTHTKYVFAKSPKGSGKTSWLESIVKELKKRHVGDDVWVKEEDKWKKRGYLPDEEYQQWYNNYKKWKKTAKKKSILVIGHRRSLITSVAKRLGLQPYIRYVDIGLNGEIIHKESNNPPSTYYAISVDSLTTLLKPKIHKYDYILIDEVEQVLSHLTSETVKDKRNETYHFFKHYIDVAEKVFVMDADLNYLTIASLHGFSSDTTSDASMIINDYKVDNKEISLFDSEAHLENELMKSIDRAERCFVCCNSKRQVKRLFKYIDKRFGNTHKVIGITSDNSNQPDIQEIIRDIKSSILEFDVMIVSPSVGTGVDITFSDNKQEIDVVYGFFQARINTHFDIDQQLSRVRNPKEIKIWISPEQFRFDTNPDVIKSEIKKTSKTAMQMIGIDSDGTIQYLTNDGYLDLYVNVLSKNRGSKNHLKKHFIKMKENDGWDIVNVGMNKDDIIEGNEIKKVSKELLEQERIDNIVDAYLITKEEYKYLKITSEKYPLLETHNYAMRRYEIESFFYMDVTDDLIVQDNDGKLRKQIREYMLYTTDNSDLLTKDIIENQKHNSHFTDKNTHLAKKEFLHTLFQKAELANDTKLLIPEKWISKNNLEDFVDFLQINKTKIQRWFDMDIRKDINEKPIQQLSVFLRLFGIKLKKKTKKGPNDTKLYFYCIPQERIDYLNEVAKRRSDSKFTKKWHLERNEINENRLFNDYEEIEFQLKEQIKHPEIVIER